MEDIESDSGADSVMVYIMPSKTEQQHNINMLQVAPEEQKPDAFDFYDSYATLHKSSSKNKLQQTKKVLCQVGNWDLRDTDSTQLKDPNLNTKLMLGP